MRLRWTAGMLVGIGLVGVGSAARGQDAPDPFDLEQRVTTATFRSRPLSEVPASVTVITRSDIRDFGFRTLADALASVRGFFVSYDRNYHILGMRGFGPLSDWGTRVLVMVDGHALVGSVYLDTPLGTDFPVSMEAVERIEIVRGPGSALYGTNAVFAVVNVVTRVTSVGQGAPGNAAALSGGMNTDRTLWGTQEFGGTSASGTQWLLHVAGFGGEGPDLYLPAYAGVGGSDGWSRGADGNRGGTLSGSVSRGGTNFRFASGTRTKEIPTGAYGVAFDNDGSRTMDDWALLDFEHLKIVSPTLALQGHLSLTRASYRGIYEQSPESTGAAPYRFRDSSLGEVADLELRGFYQPRPSFWTTFGVAGQRHLAAKQRAWDDAAVYSESNIPYSVMSGYGQVEWNPASDIALQMGVRTDHYSTSGAVTNPRVGLTWHGSPVWTWKALAGRSYRAPNLYEMFYESASFQSNPDLGPEVLWAYESSVELHPARGVEVEVTAFHHEFGDWIGIIADTTYGNRGYRNQGSLRVSGLEAEVDASAPGPLRWRLSYTRSEPRDAAGSELTNFARHIGQASVVLPLPELKSRAALLFRAVGPRAGVNGNHAPGYGVVDLNLGTDALAGNVSLGLRLRNLLDQPWGDPGGEEQMSPVLPRGGRSVEMDVHVGF